MLCSSPYRPSAASLEFRCGRCMPCRISRRREWTARCLLESLGHESSSFVTLTYEEAPMDGSVSVQALQGFLKRLRSQCGPVRFLGVGEYGSASWRPHYHLLLFGLNPSQSDIQVAWHGGEWNEPALGKPGYVLVGELTPQSAQYTCGYTVKKMTNELDQRLQGRRPEFMRCSLKNGGIGANSATLDILEKAHRTQFVQDYMARRHDVLSEIRFHGKKWPIGRYLMKKLRERVGLPAQDPRRIAVMLEDWEAQQLPELAEDRELRREAHKRTARQRVNRGKMYAKI